jgi:hypothetical protein
LVAAHERGIVDEIPSRDPGANPTLRLLHIVEDEPLNLPLAGTGSARQSHAGRQCDSAITNRKPCHVRLVALPVNGIQLGRGVQGIEQKTCILERINKRFSGLS